MASWLRDVPSPFAAIDYRQPAGQSSAISLSPRDAVPIRWGPVRIMADTMFVSRMITCRTWPAADFRLATPECRRRGPSPQTEPQFGYPIRGGKDARPWSYFEGSRGLPLPCSDHD